MTLSLKSLACRWGPALTMMLLIFLASGTPGNDIPKFGVLDFALKKGGHMTGYALLGIAYLRGLTYGADTSLRRRHLVLAVLLALFYAISDETHQRFTPQRSPSILDVGIDTVGAALGVILWTALRRRIAARSPASAAWPR